MVANLVAFLASGFWGMRGGHHRPPLVDDHSGVHRHLRRADLSADHRSCAGSSAASSCKGCFAGAIYGQNPSYLTERFPTEVRSTAAGFCYHQGAIWGGFVAPILTYFAINYDVGFGIPMMIGTCVGAVSFIISLLLGPGDQGHGDGVPTSMRSFTSRATTRRWRPRSPAPALPASAGHSRDRRHLLCSSGYVTCSPGLHRCPLLTHNRGAATQGTVSRNALRQADHTARPLHLSPARLRADRRHRRPDGADLADPVAALRRAGGEPRPVARRLPRTHRPADPQLRRGDPADHHLRRGAVHLSASGRRPRDHGDARGRAVALRAVAPGAGAGGPDDRLRLRAEPVDRARQPHLVPPVPVGDPQSHGGLPVAGRRVHADLGRSDRLCSFARSGWHAARHSGRRWARQDRACHDPGRTWPADGGTERPARVAGQRQPPGDRSSDRPAQRADVRTERDRPRRQPGVFRRAPARHVGDVAGRIARSAPAQSARRVEMDRRRAQAPGDTAHRVLVCVHRTVRCTERNLPPARQLCPAAGGRGGDGGAAGVRPRHGEPGGARQCDAAHDMAAGRGARRDLLSGCCSDRNGSMSRRHPVEAT